MTKKDKKIVFVISSIMIFMIVFGAVRPRYLKNYYTGNGGFATATAFCDKVGYKNTKQSSLPVSFHFYVEGEKIAIRGKTVPYSEPYISLQKGDTLIISYAVLNPRFCDVLKVKK